MTRWCTTYRQQPIAALAHHKRGCTLYLENGCSGVPSARDHNAACVEAEQDCGHASGGD